MLPPVVLAAFGTTTRAFATYEILNRVIRRNLPQAQIHWSYTSRRVREKARTSEQENLLSPGQVLDGLYQEGHPWAVVQSLHFLCGHEFERLVEEARESPVRTSMGLPLLSDPQDYYRVIRGIGQEFYPSPADQALLLIGHGTDHPAWACYPALERLFHLQGWPRVFTGQIEGEPGRDEVIRQIELAGFTKVRLLPFMLVAGVHFLEDIQGAEDSWEAACREAGLDVEVVPRGLGDREWLGEIFCSHIRSAMEATGETLPS